MSPASRPRPYPASFLRILGLFLAVVHAAPAPAPRPAEGSRPAPSARPAASADTAPLPRLDQKRVHEEYLNGNFEAVLQRIHAFEKENPDHSREDSVFIARHLAVVLAADPKSVEAGKYWMHRLLLLSPDADLAGMYASEAIESMFAKVKDEDDARTGRLGRRKWIWIGVGGTAAAAAIAVWFAFSHASEGPGPTVVPVSL
jgi:hypothetical protein